MARLLVFRGDFVDREVELGATPIRIGRGGDNELVLEDVEKGVSRVHAELSFEGGRYVLTDLNSQNGIWLEGNRTDRIVFQPNTVASLGSFKLMIDEASADSATGASRAGRTDAPRSPGTAYGRLSRDPADSQADPAQSRADSTPAAPGWFANNKRALLLGGAGVTLAAVIGLSTLNSTPQGPTVAERVEYHVSEAKDLIDQGNLRRALNEHLEPALLLDPNNADALSLKQSVLDRLNAPELPPAPPIRNDRVRSTGPPPNSGTSLPPGPTPPAPEPVVVLDPSAGGLTPRAGETQSALRAREQRMREALGGAKEMAAAGDLLGAETRLAGIIDEATERYLDAKATLDAVRVKKKQEGQRLLNEAMQNAEERRFEQAIDKLKRAAQHDPTLATETPIRDITARRIQLGEDVFVKAGVAYKFGSNAEALRLYEQAVQWLPKDHPHVAEAEKRIKELKR